jgi:hypothetical protein
LKFIKPKRINAQKNDWLISEQSRAIVKYYAQYSEYPESEVVDLILKRLLEDQEFMEWVSVKRFNKRIITQLTPNVDCSNTSEEEESIG